MGPFGGQLIRLTDNLLRDPGMIALEIPLLSWKWRQRRSLYFSDPDALRLVWFISSCILKLNFACVFTVLITFDSESSSSGFPFSNKVEYGCFSTWQWYPTLPTSCLGWCGPAYILSFGAKFYFLWLRPTVVGGHLHALDGRRHRWCQRWMRSTSDLKDVMLSWGVCHLWLLPIFWTRWVCASSEGSRRLPKIVVIWSGIRI